LNLHKTLVLGKLYTYILEAREEHYPLNRIDIFDVYFKSLPDIVLTSDEANELSFQIEGFD